MSVYPDMHTYTVRCIPSRAAVNEHIFALTFLIPSSVACTYCQEETDLQVGHLPARTLPSLRRQRLSARRRWVPCGRHTRVREGTELRGRNRSPTGEGAPRLPGSGDVARPPSALEFDLDPALGPVLPLRGAAPRSPALGRLLLDRGRRPAPAGSTCAGGKATFPPRPFPGGNQSSLLFPVSLRSLPFVPRYLSLPGIRAAPRWLGEGRAVAKISHLKTTMESFRPARVVPELCFRAGGRELFAFLLFSQQNLRASYRSVASSLGSSPWTQGTGQGHPAHLWPSLRRHSAFGRIHQTIPGSHWLREVEKLLSKSYPDLQSMPCSEVSWMLKFGRKVPAGSLCPWLGF